MGIKCYTDEMVNELMRCVRINMESLITDFN